MSYLQTIKPGQPVIQTEDWAEQRFELLQNYSRELKSTYPEFVGMVGFGSFFCAAARSDTDVNPSNVNLWVLLDPTKSSVPIKVTKSIIETEGFPELSFMMEEADKVRYENIIKDGLMDRLSLSPIQVEYNHVVPISLSILDESVEWLVEQAKTIMIAKETKQEHQQDFGSEENSEPLWIDTESHLPRKPVLPICFSALFFAEVEGNKLDQYRIHLMDRLSNENEVVQQLVANRIVQAQKYFKVVTD